MPPTRTLLLVFCISILFVIGFAFTIIGTVAEAIALLALLALAGRGVVRMIRSGRGSSDARRTRST